MVIKPVPHACSKERCVTAHTIGTGLAIAERPARAGKSICEAKHLNGKYDKRSW